MTKRPLGVPQATIPFHWPQAWQWPELLSWPAGLLRKLKVYDSYSTMRAWRIFFPRDHVYNE